MTSTNIFNNVRNIGYLGAAIITAALWAVAAGLFTAGGGHHLLGETATVNQALAAIVAFNLAAWSPMVTVAAYSNRS